MVGKGRADLRLAEGHADRLLRERKIDRFPVEPIAIAEEVGIKVLALPANVTGCSGMLIHYGGAFGIFYSTAIDSPGFQRFSVAHELGHYYLPGHPEAVLRDGEHRSQAGYLSSDAYEREADQFAAELLLPERLVRPVLRRFEDGLASVKGLAEVSKTSLPASAIAYARYTRSAVAVVMSTTGHVDFCSFSDALKDAGVGWLKKGALVPSGSLTADFHCSSDRILRADVEAAETSLPEWFAHDKSLPIVEEVIGLGRYGKVLTVIQCPRLSAVAEGFSDEEDDEEGLIESWTPRHRR